MDRDDQVGDDGVHAANLGRAADRGLEKWNNLRRLRLHGLIERIPKTHLSHVTDFGLQSALFFTRFYARILRPGLAIVIPPEVPTTSKLRSSFEAFEREVANWCEAATLAA
jgi:hypothetical protein